MVVARHGETRRPAPHRCNFERWYGGDKVLRTTLLHCSPPGLRPRGGCEHGVLFTTFLLGNAVFARRRVACTA
eukprot:9904730-Prorocentrum_lima.AAC.1